METGFRKYCSLLEASLGVFILKKQLRTSNSAWVSPLIGAEKQGGKTEIIKTEKPEAEASRSRDS